MKQRRGQWLTLKTGWQRRIFVWGLAGWLLLTPLALLAHAEDGLGWELLTKALDVLAGVAAGLALGTFLVDPLRSALDKERQERERRDWLGESYLVVLQNHDALRHTSAALVDHGYRTVADAGVLSATVPSATLRKDVARRPLTPGPLTSAADALQAMATGFNEVMSDRETGPLAIAQYQVAEVSAVLHARYCSEAQAYVAGVMHWPEAPVGPVPGGKRPVPPEVEAAIGENGPAHLLSTLASERVAPMALLADRLLALSGETTGCRELDAAPVQQSVVEVALAVQRLQARILNPHYSDVVGAFGEAPPTEDVVAGSSELRRAADLAGDMAKVLDRAKELRKVLGTLTTSVLELGIEIDPTAALRSASQLPQDDVLGTPASWELWRKRCNYVFDGEQVA